MLSLLLVAALAVLAPATARSADISAAQEAAVRNAIDDALNSVRDIILNGDSERGGIPVLDPLLVDEWDFAVSEAPLLTAQGSVSQVKVEGLGAFVSEQPKIPGGPIPPRVIVSVYVRVPAVSAVGSYRLAGQARTPLLADAAVDASGDFQMVVKDISINVKVELSLTFKVKNVYVILGLRDVFIDVQGAGAVGDLINSEAAYRMQTWFAENRSEMELQLADIIKKGIESYLEKEAQTRSSYSRLAPTS